MSIVYEIVNEFKFEAQSAVINMKAVQNAVGGISGAIDSLFEKAKLIPQALSSSLGLSFGAGGILYGAVSSFEKMQKSALAFTNIMSSNMEHLSGPINTFNERMQFSQELLKDFAKTAQKFSLDEGAFIDTTKTLAALLVPKGLAGTNFNTAKEMSRGLLKSAPILGVDPNFVQGELLRAAEGSASLNDTLFRRLAGETNVFQGLKKGILPEGTTGSGGVKNVKVLDSVSKMFNQLPAATRVELLTKALTQFGNDADVAAGNANLLTNKLASIKNQFTGINGVLQPLGAVIVPKLRLILDFVSKMIEKQLRPAIEQIGVLFQQLSDNPERAFATLYQLRDLKKDLNFAGKVAEILPIVLTIKYLVSLFARFPQLMNGLSRGIVAVFAKFGYESLGVAVAAGLQQYVLGPIIAVFSRLSFSSILGFFAQGFMQGLRLIFTTGLAWVFANLGKIFVGLRVVGGALLWVLQSIIAPIILTTLAFQVLSRAMGYAKLLDVKNIASYGPQFLQRFTEITKIVAQIVKPIDDIIDGIARLIAPFFGLTYIAGQDILGKILFFVDAFISALESLKNGFLNFLAGFQAIVFSVAQILTNFQDIFVSVFRGIWELIKNFAINISTGGFGKAFSAEPFLKEMSPFKAIGTAFNAGIDDIINRYGGGIVDNTGKVGDKAIVNRNTNIDKVVINNQFKENLEPDRIANSLVKTLMEVADNPRQARGVSLASGFFR